MACLRSLLQSVGDMAESQVIQNSAGESNLTMDIIELVRMQDVEAVKSCLATMKNVKDMFDSDGMTLLQHAVYRGNKDLCQMLLDHVSSLIVCIALAWHFKYHLRLFSSPTAPRSVGSSNSWARSTWEALRREGTRSWPSILTFYGSLSSFFWKRKTAKRKRRRKRARTRTADAEAKLYESSKISSVVSFWTFNVHHLRNSFRKPFFL